jgi:hypothetical protein
VEGGVESKEGKKEEGKDAPSGISAKEGRMEGRKKEEGWEKAVTKERRKEGRKGHTFRALRSALHSAEAAAASLFD